MDVCLMSLFHKTLNIRFEMQYSIDDDDDIFGMNYLIFKIYVYLIFVYCCKELIGMHPVDFHHVFVLVIENKIKHIIIIYRVQPKMS